jgi:hypothetical protein
METEMPEFWNGNCIYEDPGDINNYQRMLRNILEERRPGRNYFTEFYFRIKLALLSGLQMTLFCFLTNPVSVKQGRVEI